MEHIQHTLYVHTKSKKPYKILHIAYEEARMQKVVVYQGLYSDEELGQNPIFTRPFSEFFGKIFVEGVEVPRFTQVKFETLAFVTSNSYKFKEAQEALSSTKPIMQLNVEVAEIQSLDAIEVLEAKVKAVKELGYRNFFVDDTSLEILEWSGFPGPFVKWTNKTIGHALPDLVKDKRAIAKCIIGYCDISGNIHMFTGALEGTLVHARSTDFGFNPIFLPDGFTRTLSEWTLQEKSSLNHRAIALTQFMRFLENEK
jgi:XTP/dITP diphosphohydrolase